MNRKGVALLTVLWVLTALASLAGVTMAVARRGSRTSRNRLILSRAGWAREACGEILLARYHADSVVAPIDTVDLGRSTWCRATVRDPSAALNLNTATPAALLAVLGRPDLVDALLDWRDGDEQPRAGGAESAWYRDHGRSPPRNGPLADPAELRLVEGVDDSVMARVEGTVTTSGDGRINPLLAPAAVIAGLPGVDAAAAAFPGAHAFPPARSLDEWLARVPSSSRPGMLAAYQPLAAATVFSPSILIVDLEGGVHGTALVAQASLTVVPVGGRLAVIRREGM
jgi:hypothetical protein